mmetsp:Transcript_49463/g.122962  ORF Transcript_49463/g.122962 Transcript_49463/m.122962 type:complete len:96 (+) Transcript_49463:918-1205(+)
MQKISAPVNSKYSRIERLKAQFRIITLWSSMSYCTMLQTRLKMKYGDEGENLIYGRVRIEQQRAVIYGAKNSLLQRWKIFSADHCMLMHTQSRNL